MSSEASPSVPVAELQDVIELVIDHRGKTPKKLGGDFTSNGVPVISAIHIKDGRINWSERERYVSEEMHRKWMPVRLRENDILLTSEAPLGEVAFVPSDDDLVLSQRLFALRTKPDLMDSAFLRYFLSSAQGQSELWNRATGSTVLGIRQAELMRVMVPVPELGAQQRAGNLLRSIDRLIDVNVSTSSILESIAQTLFRSWFVDFDPVQAKMRGEKPVGMDDATAALFPDSMEESELGDIPAGWTVRLLGDFCKLVMGQSPPGSAYNGDGIGLPFFQGRADFGERFPRRRVYSTEGKRKALAGEILVSVRAPVGDINQSLEESVIGRGVASVMHLSGSEAFSFSLLKSLRGTLEYFNGEGTVFGAINKADFSSIKLVEPPRNVIAAFDEVCSPINKQIRVLHDQTESLVLVRDSLLPRLISGELQVPEDLVA